MQILLIKLLRINNIYLIILYYKIFLIKRFLLPDYNYYIF